MNERRHHDMGGLEAGLIDREEHDKAPWEKRVDALMVLLGQRRTIGVDELRRGIEELGADAYERCSYYERWMASMTNLLLEKNIIEASELGACMAEIETGERQKLPDDSAPKFALGDRVRVHERFPPGHVRTPWYCRGKTGKIERICGRFRNPEQLAYGNRDADHKVLYRVSFPSRTLWPDYDGSKEDRVETEIYEHWLGTAAGDDVMSGHEAAGGRAHVGGHGHRHGDDHGLGGYDVDPTHRHPLRPELEDTPLSRHQIMQMAVTSLLIGKGAFSADDMRAQIERMDTITPARGARLAARAWIDAGFRERLLADSKAAAAELGIDLGPIPILVMENTPETHNLVVCTLCSCYPRFLLGLPPDWYKSRNYRRRAVGEPRRVLAEFGTDLGSDVEIRVHDSTADMRYMVLPMQPAGTRGMSEEALAALVTRDSLIGVAVSSHPRHRPPASLTGAGT